MATVTSGASWLRSMATGALMLCFSFGMAQAQQQEEMEKSGTVKIEQVQIAFIGSGNLGGGNLEFRGRTYHFTVGGLGIGGFGVSKITASGDVYNLNDPNDFPGAFIQGRYGVALGDISTGKLWLKNANGVVLSLQADREGLALSLGGDAVYIGFD
jgi:hypothetical protein